MITDLLPWKKNKNTELTKHKEVNSLLEFHKKINELFDNFFNENFSELFPEPLTGNKSISRIHPDFDVIETDDSIEVKADLPGMTDKDVEVYLDNNILTIKGERKEEKEEKKGNYYLCERAYGSFHRSIPLPEGLETEKITANFKNGILTINIPKSEESKSQRKKIKISS